MYKRQVLAAGIDLDAIAVASKNTEHTVRVKSAGYRMDVVDLSDLSGQEKETGHSAALVRGVCARFQQLGYRIGGFDEMCIRDRLQTTRVKLL